ncbi:hypothetical protein BCR42DRAFT_429120 [Absidia repens]|uniref:Uncharacterized protein n=1 Tax=Absidia repens TaxID=90262 RepID=A0A1X2HXI1_9FUNG|nr:hypothetical protein BCR42DRAFT_429120 [Absidia repens]
MTILITFVRDLLWFFIFVQIFFIQTIPFQIIAAVFFAFFHVVFVGRRKVVVFFIVIVA